MGKSRDIEIAMGYSSQDYQVHLSKSKLRKELREMTKSQNNYRVILLNLPEFRRRSVVKGDETKST